MDIDIYIRLIRNNLIQTPTTFQGSLYQLLFKEQR